MNETPVKPQLVFAVGEDVLRELLEDYEATISATHFRKCGGSTQKCDCRAELDKYDSLRKLLNDKS